MGGSKPIQIDRSIVAQRKPAIVITSVYFSIVTMHRLLPGGAINLIWIIEVNSFKVDRLKRVQRMQENIFIDRTGSLRDG